MTPRKPGRPKRPPPSRAPKQDVARQTRGGIDAAVILARFDKYRLTAVLAAVEAHTGIAGIELAGGSAAHRVARARGYLFAALRSRGWSWTDIGALFDRDHSGVMHAVHRIERDPVRGPDLAAFLLRLNSAAPAVAASG